MTATRPDAVQERFDQLPSPAAQHLLQVLRAAVTQALDRKRKLGQYAVVWQGGQVQALPSDALPYGPVALGHHAPALTVQEPGVGGPSGSMLPPSTSTPR